MRTTTTLYTTKLNCNLSDIKARQIYECTNLNIFACTLIFIIAFVLDPLFFILHFIDWVMHFGRKGNGFHAVIKDVDGISPTICARYYKDGSNCLVKVAGRINSSQDGKVVYTDGIAPTFTSDHCNTSKIIEPTMRKSYESVKLQHSIRKLTPRECGRLMGVSDEDIDKMAAVNSNMQLYKQFGNSIVVDVMCAMFRNLNIKNRD